MAQFDIQDHYLHFVVSYRQYYIDASEIDVIQPVVMIHPLKSLEPGLVGTVNYHGKDITVCDVAQYLELRDASTYQLDTLMIICRISDITFALLVDEVIGIVSMDQLSGAEARVAAPLDILGIADAISPAIE